MPVEAHEVELLNDPAEHGADWQDDETLVAGGQGRRGDELVIDAKYLVALAIAVAMWGMLSVAVLMLK